jgi:hypothetical protein
MLILSILAGIVHVALTAFEIFVDRLVSMLDTQLFAGRLDSA